MAGGDQVRTGFSNTFLSLALLLGLAFWVVDSLVDRFVFHQVDLWTATLSPGGELLWMRVSTLLLLALFGGITDTILRQRKRAEGGIRARERLLRALIRSSGDGIVAYNTDMRYTLWNPAMARISGIRTREVIGRGALEIFPYLEELGEIEGFRAAVQGRATPSRERSYRIPAKDRKAFFESSHFPLLDEVGSVVGGMGIIRDITARRNAEEERRRYAETLEQEVAHRTADLDRANRELMQLQTRLVRAERLAAAEEITGNLAHSINNPLAALLGTVEMALDSPRASRASLERILHLVRRMRGVVEQAIELFRAVNLDLASHAPREVLGGVREAIEGRTRLQGIQVQVKVAEPLPEIFVDVGLLTAALVRVAENAIDALPEGGMLSLEADTVHQGRFVELRIVDTGAGIAPEIRRRVFEPFFSTKRDGVGLGLTIAQGVVRGHGGRIEVGSRPGGGAVVSIDLRTAPGAGTARAEH